MPSIATQTCWSWLQDLAEVDRLAQSYGPVSHFTTYIKDGIENLITSPEEDRTSLSPARSTTLGTAIPWPAKEEHNPPKGEVEEERVLDMQLSSKRNATKEEKTDLTLPTIVSKDSKTLEDLNGDSSPHDQNIHLPNIFSQLEQMDYSEEGEGSDVTDGDLSTSEEEESGSDEEDSLTDEKPFLPELGLATSLTWPAILQYAKESESMASSYFSLQNSEEVERRIVQARAMVGQDQAPSSSSEKPAEEDGREDLVPVREERISTDDSKDLCQCEFCGKMVPRMSLMPDALRDIENMKEEDYICCEAYKEYIIMVAVCMRQMVQKMCNAPPQKIPIQAHAQVSLKRRQEDKALAILRRKKKWKEIEERRKTEAESQRRIKGSKTIQFTLESPGKKVETSWIVRPKSGVSSYASSRKKKKERVKKKKGKKEASNVNFSKETQERLKQSCVSPGPLERRFRSDGQMYFTRLPDGTGCYNYPSGHRALVGFSPCEGTLGYLVYEDSDFPQLLACADELGRACCYFQDGSIRFLCVPHFMVQFDVDGKTKKRVRLVESSSFPVQPVMLALNKQITLKCNSEGVILMMSFPHDHLKITIISKLKKNEKPLYSEKIQSEVQEMERDLSQTKIRIGQLFQYLHNTSQIQKLSRLEVLYGGSSLNKGARIQHKWEGAEPHRRTRSSGALKLKKNVVDKHAKPRTVNLA